VKVKYNAYKTLIDNISFSFKDYFNENNIQRSLDVIFFHVHRNSPETIQKLYRELSLKNISSVKIIDKDGGSIILFNKGSPNKNSIVIRTALDSGKIMRDIKDVIFNEIIKSDIRKTLMEHESRAKQKRPLHTVIFASGYRQTALTASSSFEKQYKSFLRAHGTHCAPLAAAKTILKTMPPQDKAVLNTSLHSRGIKTAGDFKRILEKWRREVLKERPEKHIGYSQSPER
jgi:hypothetical protein